MIDLKMANPEAEIIAHPECEEPVLRHASFIGSTTALLKYTQQSNHQAFIVATEPGIIHQMEKASPHKLFIPAPAIKENCACNECPYMRLNTLEKLYLCMKNKSPELTLPEKTRQAALIPMQRMLAMS
jgi:quinolinate synthase